MDTTAPATARGTHPLVIIAAIAVTLFSMAGIAAIMGWIPASTGQAPATAQIADAAPAAPVAAPVIKAVEAAKPVPAARPAQKTASHQPAKHSGDSHTSAIRSEPVQMAAVTPPTPPAPAAQPAKALCYDCGTIESIREVQKKGEGSGLGAVAGGVLGGILGHQVGGGRGRDVMTAVGAVGGAVAGHQVEKNAKSSVSYDITVRFEDGTTRTLQQTSAPVWRPGDKVRVVNSEIVPNG